MSRRHHRAERRPFPWPLLYLVLLGLGMAARSMPDPVAAARDGDARTYVALADKLVDQHRYEEAWPAGHEFRAWRPPVYATVLAAFKAAGSSGSYVIAFQIVLFLLSGWFLHRFAAELFGAGPAGIALVLFTLNPTLFHFAYVYMSETVFNFLVLAGAVGVVRFLKTRALLPGLLASVCLGLATLTRTVTIPVVLGLAGAGIVHFAVRALRTGRRPRPPLGARALVVLALPGLLLVSAWMVRTYRVTGGFVLVATSNAVNLYFGSLESYDWTEEHERVIHPLREEYGEIGSTRELDRMAVENVLRNPLAYASRKVSTAWRYFWKLDPRGTPDTAAAAVLAVLFLAGGFWIVRSGDTGGFLVLLVHALILASVCLAFYKGRFIIPLIPFHIVVASLGAHAGFRFVRERVVSR